MTKKRQEVRTVKLRDLNFPKEVFIPLKSGKYVDRITSKKGGTMPGTITVVVGEPGSGKTTMLVDKLINIEENNENKTCLYISSEMNPLDNQAMADELPLLMDVEGFYLNDYDNPKEAMEDILDLGWDYVVLDSFMDVKDKIKDSDTCKMTATAVETWLIKLLVKNTQGENQKNKYTAFDVIQHITKGGTYAGSTKLKHNTTAMVFVRVDKKTNERFLVYVKNRRGDINKKLYMDLVDGELTYNNRRYEEMEKALETKKQIENYEKESEDGLFGILDNLETGFNVSEEKLVGQNLEIVE